MVTNECRDVDPEIGMIYRPVRAFDHGLPDVPVHAFTDELRCATDPATATGRILLDISAQLGLAYPATTPTFLAWYGTIRTGETLSHTSQGAVEFHAVLRGRGASTNRAVDRIRWSEGDCFCFPGGGQTVHEADAEALLFSVSDEPDWWFRRVEPWPNGLVAPALFEADRIDSALESVHRDDGPRRTAGKSVSFTTAGMHAQIPGALSATMMAAVNTLEAGGVQRRHRHNSVAITVAINGEGCYSAIGPDKVVWQDGLAVITPPRLAHSHTNDGPRMMKALVIQDGPVYYNTRSVGFEWTEETL